MALSVTSCAAVAFASSSPDSPSRTGFMASVP
jgi:hypothetical protein